MIAYAMLYSIAVGAPIVFAAHLVASMLRRHGRAERLVWLAALLLAVAVPVATLIQPTIGRGVAATAAAEQPTGIIGLPTVFVIPDARGPVPVGPLLLWCWLAVSVLLLVRLGVATTRLAATRGSWRPDTLDGVRVWRTETLGPAVAGLLNPHVLVPEWLMHMPAQRRSLVLLHEQEHIRARDPWLMAMSRLAPILTPWNPAIWILSSRLLRAIELDCDRRVLRHRPDVRAYGDTLIEVSARDSGRLVAVAAFAESEAPLRSRILGITTPTRAVSIVALLTSMVLGVTLILVSFQVPTPTIRADLEPEQRATPSDAPPAPESSPSGLTVEVEPESPDRDALAAQPMFTPFTVAPSLLNLDEVRQTMARAYPAVLRDAKVGGTVTVWFFVDEEGRIQQTRVNQSSGLEPLDRAALDVADVFRFTPALNRDERVPVWVSIPIHFEPR